MNAPVRLPGLPDGVDHDRVVAQMIRVQAASEKQPLTCVAGSGFEPL
jgi:hypothetical protein